jgi:hypothetical protein
VLAVLKLRCVSRLLRARAFWDTVLDRDFAAAAIRALRGGADGALGGRFELACAFPPKH